jgi:hypothetical protein
MYIRILDPVHDNEKENWRILTNKEIYAMVKKFTVTETKSLNRLLSFIQIFQSITHLVYLFTYLVLY